MFCKDCVHCKEEQRLRPKASKKDRKWWDIFSYQWEVEYTTYLQLVCTLNPKHVDVDSDHFCSHFKTEFNLDLEK